MNDTNKGKLSLQEIYNSFLNEIVPSEREYVRRYGLLLVITLSNSEEKKDKKRYDTLFVDNGYITQEITDNEEYTLNPFISSWKTLGLIDNNNEVELLKFDKLSEWVDNEKLKEVSINWKFELTYKIICKLLNKEYSYKISDHWDELKQILSRNSKTQIHMLVLPFEDAFVQYQGFETILLEGENNKEVFTVDIPSENIIIAKLVTPGNEYINKIDRLKPIIPERICEENELMSEAMFGTMVEHEITLQDSNELITITQNDKIKMTTKVIAKNRTLTTTELLKYEKMVEENDEIKDFYFLRVLDNYMSKIKSV